MTYLPQHTTPRTPHCPALWCTYLTTLHHVHHTAPHCEVHTSAHYTTYTTLPLTMVCIPQHTTPHNTISLIPNWRTLTQLLMILKWQVVVLCQLLTRSINSLCLLVQCPYGPLQHLTTLHHTTPHLTTPHHTRLHHTTPHLTTPRRSTLHHTTANHTSPHRANATKTPSCQCHVTMCQLACWHLCPLVHCSYLACGCCVHAGLRSWATPSQCLTSAFLGSPQCRLTSTSMVWGSRYRVSP